MNVCYGCLDSKRFEEGTGTVGDDGQWVFRPHDADCIKNTKPPVIPTMCCASLCRSLAIGENMFYLPPSGQIHRQPLCAEHGGREAAWKYGPIFSVSLRGP